jgi:signal transduction histidine kinase
MTMGEMTASIAHEVNQPLSGVVINGNACLRWLAGNPPNLDEAREAVQRIIRDGKRASEVIARIRALARKTSTEMEKVNINEAIEEVVALAQGEARRQGVTIHMELESDLSLVLGDRVQLQQVMLNLIMNAVEAMRSNGDRPRELNIKTQDGEINLVQVALQDTGSGLDPQNTEKIFDAFYTTKPAGLSMGLSISRSIVENHGGKLWATPNEGPGATFQFNVLKYR